MLTFLMIMSSPFRLLQIISFKDLMGRTALSEPEINLFYSKSRVNTYDGNYYERESCGLESGETGQ